MTPSLFIKHKMPKQHDPFGDIDYVPPNARLFSMRTTIYVFEDNEAAIKQIKRG